MQKFKKNEELQSYVFFIEDIEIKENLMETLKKKSKILLLKRLII